MSVLSESVEWFQDSTHWSGPDGVPARVLEHLQYSATTIGIAAAIALPIGLWVGHTGRGRTPAVLVSGAVRALPTLGLLTWFALLLGVGLEAPILALVILAVPPLLAGAYSGLESVDRSTIDAARAVGMTEWQILGRVELPLALPVLVGGLRSAVLQVVSTATVAAYLGVGGLGRYLFDGQASRDYPEMVAGSVLVIALTLVLDALLVGVQRFGTATPLRRTA